MEGEQNLKRASTRFFVYFTRLILVSRSNVKYRRGQFRIFNLSRIFLRIAEMVTILIEEQNSTI